MHNNYESKTYNYYSMTHLIHWLYRGCLEGLNVNGVDSLGLATIERLALLYILGNLYINMCICNMISCLHQHQAVLFLQADRLYLGCPEMENKRNSFSATVYLSNVFSHAPL